MVEIGRPYQQSICRMMYSHDREVGTIDRIDPKTDGIANFSVCDARYRLKDNHLNVDLPV